MICSQRMWSVVAMGLLRSVNRPCGRKIGFVGVACSCGVDGLDGLGGRTIEVSLWPLTCYTCSLIGR
jgi:hypothetical protein